jgi:hypothetical protein
LKVDLEMTKTTEHKAKARRKKEWKKVTLRHWASVDDDILKLKLMAEILQFCLTCFVPMGFRSTNRKRNVTYSNAAERELGRHIWKFIKEEVKA